MMLLRVSAKRGLGRAATSSRLPAAAAVSQMSRVGASAHCVSSFSSSAGGSRLRDRLQRDEVLGDSTAIQEFERRKRESAVRQAWKPTIKGTDTLDELHLGILMYFKYKSSCPDKWLRLLLRRVETPADYYKGLDCYLLFLRRGSDLSEDAEVSGLLLNAAVRAGIPEAGLKMLANVWGFRFFPGNKAIGSLLQAFVKGNDLEGVRLTWDSVQQRHIDVGPGLSSSIIVSHLTLGDVAGGVRAAVQLLRSGARVSSHAASLAVQHARTIDDGDALHAELIEETGKRGIELRPWVEEPLPSGWAELAAAQEEEVSEEEEEKTS